MAYTNAVQVSVDDSSNITAPIYTIGANVVVSSTSAVSSNYINSTGSNLSDGDIIQIVDASTTTLITAGKDYYVVSADANKFKVSESFGGAAVAIVGGTPTFKQVNHYIDSAEIAVQGIILSNSGATVQTAVVLPSAMPDGFAGVSIDVAPSASVYLPISIKRLFSTGTGLNIACTAFFGN